MPDTVTKPWGAYEVLAEGGQHLVKRLHVNPGQRTSLQRHTYRSEVWVCTGGQGRLERDGTTHELYPSAHFRILPHHEHRLVGMEPDGVTIIEVQLGRELSEQDIVRIEDDYGRA